MTQHFIKEALCSWLHKWGGGGVFNPVGGGGAFVYTIVIEHKVYTIYVKVMTLDHTLVISL